MCPASGAALSSRRPVWEFAGQHRSPWQGCRETFSDTMPKGWVWLLAYWAPEPKIVLDASLVTLRDAALCSTHARALDAQLKPLTRQPPG